MLPSMLAHGLCDTHWFFCFDTGGQIVDFNGTSKHLLDQLAAPSHTDLMISPEAIEAELSRTQEETVQDTLSPVPNRQTFTIPDGYEAVLDADGRATGEVRPVPAGQHCELTIAHSITLNDDATSEDVANAFAGIRQGVKSWRRL